MECNVSRHMDHAENIWVWTAWKDQEQNRNVENTVYENTALALTAVASLFQKDKTKMFFISTVGRTKNN